MRKIMLIAGLFLGVCLNGMAAAFQTNPFISETPVTDGFTLFKENIDPVIVVDELDEKGVLRAVNDLRQDFQRVNGRLPAMVYQGNKENPMIIAGTLGKSQWVEKSIASGQLNRSDLEGKREKYIIRIIKNPVPGVEEALLIAGSDKRGTIYGIYELSAQIGVSPWYYWADVPVEHKEALYFIPGTYTAGEPAVQYRGIFFNDEAPALRGWVLEKFGDFNHDFHEKVFELILRLKGNFLWPAMWDPKFYDDDPVNSPMADLYGIVIGTSHHEPLARAHKEWIKYGKGEWNYETNKEVLREFWRYGVERMKNTEDVLTVGMRGDGDAPMSRESNIALLERIIKDQRNIIEEVTGKDASETPQVWALYKEVQDYYDKGMRVPDDVTLLLCDDNWGNVRKLPNLTDKPRKGGYGMYYHFDYVGGPRSYKWLNVSQIQRIWEQMNLTYRYGVDKLWVVNVGDLKPMEYPITFFLDFAWNPDRYNENNLLQHTEDFCAQQFGTKYAKEAARLINLYTKYNHRVTPELLSDKTYSLKNYDELETVTNEYNALLLDAMNLNYLLPAAYKDAFDQLVLYPIAACANLYEMYYAVAKNKELAAQGNVLANEWANKVKACYQRDSLLSIHYNNEIANGKWNHFMDQTHIGYTYWASPDVNKMPKVQWVSVNPPVDKDGRRTFIEKDGYVSIEAEHFSAKKENDAVKWIVIPDFGKTLSGVTTTPVTATAQEDSKNGPWLEYDMELTKTGEAKLKVLLAPTLNFNANKGLRYAVSIDGGPEQIVNFNEDSGDRIRESWVAAAIIESSTTFTISDPGKHTLRFRAIDPGIVLEKILLDLGGLKPSYLGAPESEFKF